MKYRLLGKSGLQVSEAALGTMTFGDDEGKCYRPSWSACQADTRSHSKSVFVCLPGVADYPATTLPRPKL
jgi:aryl-alcohol dehydrogenase-like predicted oxidoreductase